MDYVVAFLIYAVSSLCWYSLGLWRARALDQRADNAAAFVEEADRERLCRCVSCGGSYFTTEEHRRHNGGNCNNCCKMIMNSKT